MGVTRPACAPTPKGERTQPLPGENRAGWKQTLEQQDNHPNAVLSRGADRTERSRRKPTRGKEQRNLPQGIRQIGQNPELEASHDFLAFWLNRSVSSANFLASIWPFLRRLITSSSLEPPNMRSIRSRTPCPKALASVMVAL